MSYSKFGQELSDLYKFRKENNIPFDLINEELRDTWIKDKRYSDLTKYINENWDSGNGDGFVKPYSEHLIKNWELSQFKKLWKSFLRHRTSNLWRDYDYVKSNNPQITLAEIQSQNLKGFNQFSSSESTLRRLAWEREYVLKGIDEYRQGLEEMKDNSELEKIERLYNDIDNLIRPKAKPSSDKRKIDETLF